MVIHNMKNIEKLYFLVGLIVAAIAAFLMFNGSIFGENTTGIATVLTIFAISLIAKRSRT